MTLLEFSGVRISRINLTFCWLNSLPASTSLVTFRSVFLMSIAASLMKRKNITNITVSVRKWTIFQEKTLTSFKLTPIYPSSFATWLLNGKLGSVGKRKYHLGIFNVLHWTYFGPVGLRFDAQLTHRVYFFSCLRPRVYLRKIDNINHGLNLSWLSFISVNNASFFPNHLVMRMPGFVG